MEIGHGKEGNIQKKMKINNKDKRHTSIIITDTIATSIVITEKIIDINN